MRFFYHPESDSLFTTSDDEEGIDMRDPLCEEIDEETYLRIAEEHGAYTDRMTEEFTEAQFRTGLEDMFEDLLG